MGKLERFLSLFGFFLLAFGSGIVCSTHLSLPKKSIEIIGVITLAIGYLILERTVFDRWTERDP